MSQAVDPHFRTSSAPVMALVKRDKDVLIYCRNDGGCAEVRQHLGLNAQEGAVTSPVAFRSMPRSLMRNYHVATTSICRVPEADIPEVAYRLTQTADGGPTHHLMSKEMAEMALSASAQRRW